MSKTIVGPQCEKDDQFTKEKVAEILNISSDRIKRHEIRRLYEGEVVYRLYALVD
jgi:hypothetical protein